MVEQLISNLPEYFQGFEFSQDKGGNPILNIQSTKSFSMPQNQLFENIEDLPPDAYAFYQELDKLIDYLKSIGLCDNQHNSPSEASGQFFHSQLRLYAKHIHQDVEKSKKYPGNLKPILFEKYRIEEGGVTFTLGAKTLTPRSKEVLSAELTRILNISNKPSSRLVHTP